MCSGPLNPIWPETGVEFAYAVGSSQVRPSQRVVLLVSLPIYSLWR